MSDRSSGDFRANEQRAFTGTKTFNRLVDAMMRGDGPAMGAGLHIPWSVPVLCSLSARARDGTNFRWRYTARVMRVLGEYEVTADTAIHSSSFIAWNCAEWATTPTIPKVPVRYSAEGQFLGQLICVGDFVFFMFRESFPEMVPVNLAVDGGSDGTGLFAPTYTYTVTHTISGTELGTTISPEMQRVIGKIVPATRGIAVLYQSPVRLWWCDEVPEVTNCSA
jgi:hypothetical protein